MFLFILNYSIYNIDLQRRKADRVFYPLQKRKTFSISFDGMCVTYFVANTKYNIN